MKILKCASPGEEGFALHCRAEKLSPEREHRFHPERMWRFDFAFVGPKVAVEIEGGIWSGGGHNRGNGYEKDCEKYAEAVILGWRVLRFTTDQVMSGYAIDCVLKVLKGSK